MADWRDAIDRHIDAMAGELREVRRHLHAHPEPSREEFQTTLYLADRLGRAGVPHRVAPMGRGIIAGPGPLGRSPAVALRGDIDALWIHEANAVAYRSTRDGLMHACGHDAHAAMALGAALALHACRDRLPRPLAWRAILQPAEEVGDGAHEMVAAGALEGVGAIVALHVDPDLEVGRVATRPGVLTAFCQDIEVQVLGLGGHGARPHLAIDPIAAAAQFITAAYQALPRSVDTREPVVVSFGAIAGGHSSNVIPERVELKGTLRTLGRAAAAPVRERLIQVARGVSETTRAEVSIRFGHDVDAVVNDPRVTAVCTRAAGEVVGVDRVGAIALPSMGSEDFAGYLDHAPGCLMRLGVATPGSTHHGLHSPHFDLDERALAVGAKALVRAAVLLAEDLGDR